MKKEPLIVLRPIATALQSVEDALHGRERKRAEWFKKRYSKQDVKEPEKQNLWLDLL